MKYAIIQAGAHQLRAEEGATIEIDRLSDDVGASVDFPVVMFADGENVQVGNPLVDGAKVTATIMEHVRGPKIRVFKYKPKVRYRVRQGHRQELTRLRVDTIAG
ncbi:MAG: 50S ribosomal protein L21 [Anaerolineales bacterium]